MAGCSTRQTRRASENKGFNLFYITGSSMWVLCDNRLRLSGACFEVEPSHGRGNFPELSKHGELSIFHHPKDDFERVRLRNPTKRLCLNTKLIDAGKAIRLTGSSSPGGAPPARYTFFWLRKCSATPNVVARGHSRGWPSPVPSRSQAFVVLKICTA